jgi:tetratricopeptide (TPR) repeat protein
VALTAKKNPIEKRLDTLVALWETFAAESGPRGLRWLVDRDESRLVDSFLEVENSEHGKLPAIFMRFEQPFQDPERHGFLLLQALSEQYEEIREVLRAEDLPDDWKCPATSVGATDVRSFAVACHSLQSHYKTIMAQFVAVLLPNRVENYRAWQNWLRRLLRSGLPETIRIMVVDDLDQPSLEALAQSEPELLQTIRPGLDMPGAYAELAKAGNPSEPGVAFRRQFLALTQAAGKGDLVGASRSGDAALAIAREHNWPQMQLVIHMALGAATLGAKKVDEAVAHYRRAGKLAMSSVDDPAAPKLLLQSRLAEATALFSGGRYVEAADVYQASAGLAKTNQDRLMEMESWRMAAYCHEQARQLEPSWRCGQKALDVATEMDDQTRANSTLPFVGQSLLRVLGDGNSEWTKQVRERMAKLAGADWENRFRSQEPAL